MPVETLSGQIERITFHSQETGFFVLRAKVQGQRDLITMVGKAMRLTAGEYIECSGSWFNDKEYGLQFKVEELTVTTPTSIEGIEKYLASGLIKGIGKHFAKVLVKKFGAKVFDVIENQPQTLVGIPGIGKKRQKIILAAWQEQKAIREIMVFLQTYGVSTARAFRIYKTYGNEAISKVRENPYRLALDVYGIGFKTADELAMRLGIEKNSINRAEAGIRHALQEFTISGHTAVVKAELIAAACTMLEIPEAIILNAIQRELKAENIVLDLIDSQECLFLAALYRAEDATAKHLARLKSGAPPWGAIAGDKALAWVEEKTHLKLSPSQQNAVLLALKEKVMVITGGPGVGKTTIVNSILKIVRTKNISIALAAPTGRAAKRLSETTHLNAKTIHRLLEFDPKTRGFKRNQFNPLDASLVVIDEASMIDISLMHQLLRAIPNNAALLIVGDVDQLPSVGPGTVLADIINSQTLPVMRLTEIFRQAKTSRIIVNAHRVNNGEFPYKNEGDELSDFYVIPAETPEEIQAKLLHVVTERIPQRFNLNPLEDIQILTPMNRGGLGARSLNIILQNALNPHSEPKISRFGTTYSPGDKVIQNVNNYDKEVFNGDIGRIASIDLDESALTIDFGGRFVEYSFNELDEIALAYATSIHKCQGSEYPAIVIPLATQHFMLLARNLLYTGITRGKKLVVIICQMKALAIAIKNLTTKPRLTKLKQRLQEIIH